MSPHVKHKYIYFGYTIITNKLELIYRWEIRCCKARAPIYNVIVYICIYEVGALILSCFYYNEILQPISYVFYVCYIIYNYYVLYLYAYC